MGIIVFGPRFIDTTRKFSSSKNPVLNFVFKISALVLTLIPTSINALLQKLKFWRNQLVFSDSTISFAARTSG